MRTAEQVAREILARMDVDDALAFTAGDVVELANIVDDIRRLHGAVMKAGPVPEHHFRVERQHRKEWPVLWQAIDRLVTRAVSWDDEPDVDE